MVIKQKYTRWTHCPACMTTQDHKHEPDSGWVCTKCNNPNPNLPDYKEKNNENRQQRNT